MTQDTRQQIQQRQLQKQREQQQQQKVPHSAPGGELPWKEHQSKHNTISETAEADAHNCNQ
jgi:hypothetical protein